LPLIETHLDNPETAKFLANWFINIEIPLRREGEIQNILKDAERAEIYLAVYKMVKAGQLSSTSVKSLLAQLLETDVVPKDVEAYAAEKGLLQVSDEGEIAGIVKQVLADNPKAAEDVKNGEMKAIGFLVGQVMKHSKGQANPSLAQDLIKRQLRI
jgi:aspartyl-tRNA(Asn)/glutamyl-tRNA(Gln) amidotransferase subunit B